jgi:hypothetical protein
VFRGYARRQRISTHGDVLVNRTADGVDLNEIWAEVQTVLELWNNERTNITDLLSFKTVNVADVVPQSWTTDSFEEATEFGIPRAIRPPSGYLRLGYPFKDFDLRTSLQLEVSARRDRRTGANPRNPRAGSRQQADDQRDHEPHLQSADPH